jgi:signal transduction histidine kinase
MTTVQTINLIIGLIEIVLVISIVLEARRLNHVRSAMVWGFIGFFAIDALVAINRSEVLWQRSESFAKATVLDALALVVLVAVLVQSRTIVRGAAATVDLARLRAADYERARRDYTQVVRHRMMNPLTVIEGAARTLEAETKLDPGLRRDLLKTIIDSALVLKETTLEPEKRDSLERGLTAVPQSDRKSAPGKSTT